MVELRRTFGLHSYEVDAKERLTFRALTNFLQEVADAHASELGVGMQKLAEEDLAWVLHRLRIETHRFPRVGSRLDVITWPSGFDRVMASREWRIESEGDLVAEASSQWVMVNMVERKLARLPDWAQALGHEQGVVDRKPLLTMDKGKFDKLEQVDIEHRYEVRRGDLDLVGHVNNTRYIEWALETVPDSVWETMEAASLEILFRREANYGQTVRSVAQALPEHRFVHRLIDAEDERELCQAMSRWRSPHQTP